MPLVLVTGSRGQLGSELQVLAPLYRDLTFQFMDSASLNITDEAAVQQWFAENKPGYCINCAAYTAVDKAETEKRKLLRPMQMQWATWRKPPLQTDAG